MLLSGGFNDPLLSVAWKKLTYMYHFTFCYSSFSYYIVIPFSLSEETYIHVDCERAPFIHGIAYEKTAFISLLEKILFRVQTFFCLLDYYKAV